MHALWRVSASSGAAAPLGCAYFLKHIPHYFTLQIPIERIILFLRDFSRAGHDYQFMSVVPSMVSV